MSKDSISKMLNKRIDYNRKIIIWGTGNTAVLYNEGLSRVGLDKEIIGYADNDESKWGKHFNDKRIYNCEEVKKLENVLVLVVSANAKIMRAIGAQLDFNSIEWMYIDEYIFCRYKEDVLKCYDLLNDDYSKKVFEELIFCRIQGSYPSSEIIDRDQYFSFAKFADFDANETYLDCGAYVGDTIEKYINFTEGSFKKIIAFEPDTNNYSAMNYRLDRLKHEWGLSDDRIEVYPYGLSNCNTVNFIEKYSKNNGLGSKIVTKKSDDTDECKVVAIDEFIKEEIGFIKADIEGYEYRMLEGAKNSIIKYSPKLAICLYHNAFDFFQIPLLINNINNKYKLDIRHYSHIMLETVVYAYIEE